MKLLHTGDWHLGKWLERFQRLEEQKSVLEEICALTAAEDPDAVIIAGDIFDSFNPGAEATQVFFQTLKALSADGRRAVIVIAGNHDSPDRIEAPEALAREHGILLAGYPHSETQPFRLESGLEVLRSAPGFVELRLPRQAAPLRILLTPYAQEQRMRRALPTDRPEAALREALSEHWRSLAETYCDPSGVNILAAHLYMMEAGGDAPEEPEDERPINPVGNAQAIFTENLPAQLQYVALGHLHRCHRVPGPVSAWYSGSPLSYSFAESGQTKYFLRIEAEPGTPPSVTKLPLQAGRPLLRHTAENTAAALEWLAAHPDAYVELSLKTDTWISAEDRRSLLQAHSRLIGPIPILSHDPAAAETRSLDLSRPVSELFTEYFTTRFQQAPSEDLLHLLTEILGQEDPA